MDAIDAEHLLNYRDTVIVITPEYIKPVTTKFSIFRDRENSLSKKNYMNIICIICCKSGATVTLQPLRAPDDELRKWNSRQGGICLGTMEFWLEYIGLCLLHLTEAKAVVSISFYIFCFIERL